MRETITLGPFGLFFTNVNHAMHLPGHSHYAELTLVYRNLGPVGFPAFASTYAPLQEHLKGLTKAPFRDATNEDVARRLFASLDGWTDPAIEEWHGQFRLDELRLAVRGVLDAIGHADGYTTYTVARE